MGKRWWGGAVAALALLACAGPADAGTYDVVSCGAPGANGVNRAWALYPGFDDRFWDMNASCPAISASSQPTPGVTAPYFTGAGFRITAPPGAILDRMVIWRTGYRFNSSGTAQGPWAVGGYRGDGTVIGGPLFGETCVIPPGQTHCSFGAAGMAPDARVERDLETNEVLYSVSCFEQPGCATANDQGFPFTAVSIAGSVVTVRDEQRPAVIARGRLLAAGWHTDEAPLSFGARDAVGIRRLRVLVDGAPVRSVSPRCDFTAMVPCAQVGERAERLGIPDGRHVVGVEATDSAGNTARSDHQVAVDREAPALSFVPARGGRRIAVAVADLGSGATAGTIEVRRGRRPFGALAARLRPGRLVARLARGSRTGLTIRATATDAVGHRSVVTGAPVRLRAGFGRALRRSVRARLGRSSVVRGRLARFGGRPLARRAITVSQRPHVDGAPSSVAARATTNAKGRFRVRIPAGASRVLRVTSSGTGGVQAGLRRLALHVPWSSSLTITPDRIAPGGRVRLSGRLRLRGRKLPSSGKRVELQAFDRGRWRVFATTRARGARAAWHASYRFGTRAGSYRIRARIPHEGTLPFDRGYTRTRTVTVR